MRGSYRWQRTTPATDTLEIDSEDELYARLPLGAASLEAELKRAGKLSVQTTVAGQLRLEDDSPPTVPARRALRPGHPPGHRAGGRAPSP